MRDILLLVLLMLTSATALSGEDKPYFSMSNIEKRKLLENVNNIKTGDTYESVISILGKPTYNQIAMRKENTEKIGRHLSYYAVKWEKDLVNEIHDQFVLISLDNTDRVENIYTKIYIENE